MLQRLCIHNVALIEGLDLEFASGLNVLTGETGAGKSIVIDAVNLVLGERASRELIKHDAEKARVEAVFTDIRDARISTILEENGIDAEDELIVSRELAQSGKNVCRINGTLVTLSLLKSITDRLVDIHGQHEHQALLNPLTHISFLDACAPAAQMKPLKEKVAATAAAYHALLQQDKLGAMSEDERMREMDLLRYQINEIDAASLQADEEETLMKERALLMNAEKIMEALQQSYSMLNDEQGVMPQLQSARHGMEAIGEYDEAYAKISERLSEAYYMLEDTVYTLRDCKSGFEFDVERLAQIEERLDLLASLKRKYGQDLSAVLAFCTAAKDKLDALENAAMRQAKLQAEREACAKAYRQAAKALSTLRASTAKTLKTQVEGQLHDLGMSKADFQTRFSEAAALRFSPEGEDDVEFLLSANAGEPVKPLAKVASGGELSRIMLAFKAIFADRDAIPTLIFDEIDTGISGRMASVVGEKMVCIAMSHQVLCVTHLPQIAALADVHYIVEKQSDKNATHTRVRRLDDEGCVERLCDMMSGGTSSASAREHARELLLASRKDKAALRKK
ncbi:MAG: DNA repair protein RecN [Clostridia bacterium]|nr:DNA repair protein RecN [Clostridia bacterium]